MYSGVGKRRLGRHGTDTTGGISIRNDGASSTTGSSSAVLRKQKASVVTWADVVRRTSEANPATNSDKSVLRSLSRNDPVSRVPGLR